MFPPQTHRSLEQARPPVLGFLTSQQQLHLGRQVHFTTGPHSGPPRGLAQTWPHLTGAAQTLPRTTLDANCHFLHYLPTRIEQHMPTSAESAVENAHSPLPCSGDLFGVCTNQGLTAQLTARLARPRW